MNFFDAQDDARRVTRRLIVVYLISTVLIVTGIALVTGLALGTLTSQSTGGFNVELFLERQGPVMVGAAVLATLVIIGATLYKVATLSAGGGRVARDIGGVLVSPDTNDPLRRRLRNVVEEMAIASGVPVPEIYVLEEESGINAFAAGYTTGDAAIAVTRGTLELLDRDELQGVIAHEFSHILNGDMRLNIRLMGVLFGITVLGLIGRIILRGSRHTGRRGKGSAPVVVVGLGLFILGWIGVFFARLIKASVSRQREYLADASAVQFTRQTRGIADALKKIGGYHRGSYITSTDPEEVAHMLFGTGARLRGAFATHPPLTDRIRAIEPNFDESDYPIIDPRERQDLRDVDGAAPAEGLASAFAGREAALSADAITDSVGKPVEEHVLYAQGLRSSIPADLYDAAHSPELAYLLAVSLVLDRDGRTLERQLVICTERLGEQRVEIIRRLYDSLSSIGLEFRLPLLEIAFPALKKRPVPHLTFLIELCSRLIDVDGDIDLYEFCYLRILTVNLKQAVDPAVRHAPRRAPKKEIRDAAINLLRIVANYGAERPEDAETAFRAGLATLPKWAANSTYDGGPRVSIDLLNHSLNLMLTLNGAGRRTLLKAISAVAMADGQLSVAEGEVLRAITATLELPLPPIVGTAYQAREPSA